jgi:hypothetical protein
VNRSHTPSQPMTVAINSGRRRLLQAVATWLILPAVGYMSRKVHAQALPPLQESDPKAQQLGYAQDATRVDDRKFPKRAGADGREQFCHSCQLYTGSAQADWGRCPLFPGKQVNRRGWCNAWVRRAG